ncbi:PREDICTED: zinc finger and SCAN domain-containing protein 4-like [Myotis brandtii]|uniref:zinc finger and SCAN domain-containing protein 4-like n=1 Tax=Myotis brandtii TaxID=109478 RepID=UPI000704214F|nr:PREDICTED: zinc finger and SCAN domain-containing protein 4-like [Myotis brandtii]
MKMQMRMATAFPVQTTNPPVGSSWRKRALRANGSHVHGVAELQGIIWSFYSWLQPDTHSKQDMIFQLSVEQFLLNRPSSERAAWQEKWESSGRDMAAFMEQLRGEVLRPPRMIPASMKGQEALFSENMPFGQVWAILREQCSAAAPTALTPGTPSPTSPETPRPAAPGDADEDGDNLSSPDPPPPPCSSCRERALRARGEKSLPEAPREAGSAQKLYRCDQCPQVFRYLSRFQLHQRRHNKERPFACATCGKGFFQASDLHVHQLIHAEKRPFRCGRCDRAFSHRTNLQAHERIHTGAKPYACAQCGRTYRQSSTYHRHLRMHQRKASGSGASTPGDTTSRDSTSRDSTAPASTSRASTSRDSMPTDSMLRASTSRDSIPRHSMPGAFSL